MGKLHSNGDPHSIQHTRRVIEKVFGRKFEDIIDSFEEKPIGCGAIAQVCGDISAVETSHCAETSEIGIQSAPQT
jgi:hypothetical protein